MVEVIGVDPSQERVNVETLASVHGEAVIIPNCQVLTERWGRYHSTYSAITPREDDNGVTAREGGVPARGEIGLCQVFGDLPNAHAVYGPAVRTGQGAPLPRDLEGKAPLYGRSMITHTTGAVSGTPFSVEDPTDIRVQVSSAYETLDGISRLHQTGDAVQLQPELDLSWRNPLDFLQLWNSDPLTSNTNRQGLDGFVNGPLPVDRDKVIGFEPTFTPEARSISPIPAIPVASVYVLGHVRLPLEDDAADQNPYVVEVRTEDNQLWQLASLLQVNQLPQPNQPYFSIRPDRITITADEEDLTRERYFIHSHTLGSVDTTLLIRVTQFERPPVVYSIDFPRRSR